MFVFLSHNCHDKEVVEPIAIRLADIFGKENIFYDSWSIQPGDGIIDKMNEGLSQTTFFFFFVSRNSLQSNMVKLEWQNALYKAAKGNCKFIPIKIDDCVMPELLLQNLYIDFYNYGFEVGLSQMVSVISGKNTFTSTSHNFSNIIAKLRIFDDSHLEIEICALHFQEPISHFLVLFDNDPEQVSLDVKTDGFFASNSGKGMQLNDGNFYNYHFFGVSRAVTPGFPVRFDIKTKDGSKLILRSIMKEIKEGQFEGLQIEIVN